jgi:uncharacterized membrane protein YdbT with pleckstrin-like domain
MKIKPSTVAFIWSSVIRNTVLSALAIFFFLLVFVFPSVTRASGSTSVGIILLVVAPVLIGLFSFVLSVIDALIRVRKEEYMLLDDKIVMKTGGLFSDREVQLPIKNITHLDRTTPWLENMLFGTGELSIKSAGSDHTEIKIRSVKNFHELTKKVIELMIANGFSMQSDDLRIEEKPVVIGVLFESLATVVASAFLLFYFWAGYIQDIFVIVNRASTETVGIIFLLFIAFILVIAFVAGFCIRFLDLQNRVYSVYKDTIIFNEGYLTKHYSIMPVENLTDSTKAQSLFQRILGIYNISISTKGSGQEIVFKNMPHGDKMESVIDEIAGQKMNVVKATEAGISTADNEVKATQSTVQRNYTDYVAVLKMDFFRISLTSIVILLLGLIVTAFLALIPILSQNINLSALPIINIMIWLFIAVVAFLGNLINYYANTYYINARSIKHDFKFLSAQSMDFNVDKISGISIRMGLIDQLLKTADITFYSVGSNQNIIFRAVKVNAGVLDNLLKKFGFTHKGKGHLEEIKPSFNPLALVSRYFPLITLALFAVAMITTGLALQESALMLSYFGVIILMFLGLVLLTEYIQLIQSALRLYPDYLEIEHGLITKRFDYAHYDDVKNVVTVKYPLVDYGKIKFNILGEQLFYISDMQSNSSTANLYNSRYQQRQQVQFAKNNFSLPLMPGITKLDDLIDSIILNRTISSSYKREDMLKQIDAQVEVTKSPSLLNSLIWILPVCIIIFPLILVMPFMILEIALRKYELEKNRLVVKSGIIYRKQTSLLYSRIDNIEKQQGLLGKILGNANINLHTVGSKFLELQLLNIKGFEEVYEFLQKKLAESK